MNEYTNKVILCTVADNDAIRSTRVEQVSPNGKYVLLGGPRIEHEQIGWVRCIDVTVLDVLP